MKKILYLGFYAVFFSFLFAQEIPAEEKTENNTPLIVEQQESAITPTPAKTAEILPATENVKTESHPTLLEFDDIPGSYVIYANSSAKETTYLGISVYEKNSLLVRIYNPNKKTFSLFFCELELFEKDGTAEIAGIAHDALGAPDPGEEALVALETVCALAEHWHQNKEALVNNIQATHEGEVTWQYEYWIPVFQLRSAAQEGTGLELITAGIMDSLVDERFISFEGLPEIGDGSSYAITPAEKLFPVIDGMQIPLDENWVSRDDRFFFLQSGETIDALFFMQTFDFSIFGTQNMKEIIRQQLRSLKAILLAQETRVFELPDGTVNIFLRSYDPEANQALVEQYQYIRRNQTRFSIATLSCFETMYLANKDYFDKIIY